MFWAILQKEIKVEWRSREVWATGLFFSLLLATIFLLGFDRQGRGHPDIGPGVLWIAIVFLSNIALGRSFTRERESGCLQALRLVPSIHGQLFWAKCLGNALLLMLMELMLVPLVALIFTVPLWRIAPGLLVGLILGTLGLSALGTVIGAALVHIRLRDVLLPLVLFPLVIPLLVAGVRSTGALVEGRTDLFGDWIGLMVAFDAIFLVLSRWLFHHVIEAVE